MITRSEWVGVVSGLRYAKAHGCLSKNGRIPFDEPNLRAVVQEAIESDTQAEYHDWVYLLDQEVEYGGVAWRGDVTDLKQVSNHYVTGTMSIFNGELTLTLVRNISANMWQVSTGRLAPEVL